MLAAAMLARIIKTMCGVWGLPNKLHVNKVFMFILHRNKHTQSARQTSLTQLIFLFECHIMLNTVQLSLLLDLLSFFGWNLQILLITHVHRACQQHINLMKLLRCNYNLYFSNYQLAIAYRDQVLLVFSCSVNEVGKKKVGTLPIIASYSCNLFLKFFKGAKIWWLFAQLYKNPTDYLFVCKVSAGSRFQNQNQQYCKPREIK